MACNTWCACHAYGGFYVLQCLSYALLYLLVELYLCGLQHLVCLPYLWELLFLKMLILCLTVLISIYWLGVLAILMGAFMSCNAYFMPYYFCYSYTYIACNTWCTCHTYGGFYHLECLSYALLYLLWHVLIYHLVNLSCLWGLLFLDMLILCLTIFTIICTYLAWSTCRTSVCLDCLKYTLLYLLYLHLFLCKFTK